MITRKPATVLICMHIILMLLAPAGAEEAFKINTSVKPPFSTVDQDGFIDRIVKELFARLEVPVEIVRLPPERAMIHVNNGVSDGDLPRVGGLSATYPDIVQVPEKIVDYSFVAFSQQERITNLSYDSIRDKRVGIIVGWKIYENATAGFPHLTTLALPPQLFGMLASGRLDVGLYERYAGQYIVRSRGFENIHECSPPLAVKPMYLYVHKKHGEQVEAMAEALRQMKSDGIYGEILRETMAPGP